LANLTFHTAPTDDTTTALERMRINPSGNISINNTNDTYQLDVSGDIRATN
jgi:hypothetical protein